ncbi:PEP-CTERM sorting domain-containing protein [Terriglobus aquaticus]|uniref:PEP-CTERM sorting domain-containing protein n=1 Tax=Terriglobus aquaticus TaxID=940139 RepID=A0ABW9KLX3_9BACT|nr:PEP-CTERM sorting domain-containing protein [Terriglobus aquaticus]
MRGFVPALFSLLLLPVAAHADTFNISVSTDSTTYSGSISGANQGDGSFLITSVSPGFAGFPGTISVTDPTNSVFGADDLFFPADSRLFDVNGLELSGIFGTANLYLFNGGPGYYIQGFDSAGNYFNQAATVSLSTLGSAPEPSSVLLSFTGLLAIGGVFLSKRFTASASSATLA